MKNWSSLHHLVWRHLKAAKLIQSKKKQFLVCVSGGADSMALLHIMKDLPLSVEAFHAHHGPGENQNFRDQAARFVEDFCLQNRISLKLIRSPEDLKSENQMRLFRRKFMFEWKQQCENGVLVTAHHAQDLLETRILRLIRGTGPQGLQSMSLYKPPFFRPFLESSPEELRNYLHSHQLKWCEDPSNQNPRYLRNWLRHRWLPSLEKRKPGSLSRLAASLESLIPETKDLPTFTKGLDLTDYMSMSSKDQLQALAHLLRAQGLMNFTQGQLKEVQRRLDNPQKRLTFELADQLWFVNAQRITLRKRGE